MLLRDVPREEWDNFFTSFNRQHRNEPVTVEKSDIRDGLHVAARAAPLTALTHDPVAERISVTVADTPSGEVTHTVAQADGIAIEEPAAAGEAARLAVHFTGGGQHLVIRLGPEREVS